MSSTLFERSLARAADLLDGARDDQTLRMEEARAALLVLCPHPLALAMHLDHTMVATPAIEMVSRRWVATLHRYDGRNTTSIGTQQGKSSLATWTAFWALLEDPERRIVFASFAMGLARTAGRAIRNLVEMYGEPYGLTLDRSHHDAADWSLAGHRGGVFSAGAGQPGSRLTGTPCDFMVLDDLLSGEGEAHSEASRTAVETWWESTARVRLRPGSAVISIGTRWSERDILSKFIAEGWERINIPAKADPRIVDSIEDVPGARTGNGYLVSTRGTTEDDWEQVRREVGERAWSALFQGNPTPLEGGVFQRDWFETYRVTDRDDVPELVEIAVGVDPADTGTGDDAGVLVAGRGVDAHLYVLDDRSGMLSQAQWGRACVIAWLVHDAARIIQERTLGMQSTIPDAWATVRRQAIAIREHGTPEAAQDALRAKGDDLTADLAQLVEVGPFADDVLSRPSSGPRVEAVTPRQSKLVRAQSITALFETGRAHIVGKLPQLEHECATWVPTSRFSPARVDTLAHLLTRLDVARVPTSVSSPTRQGSGGGRVPTRSAPGPRRAGGPRRR